MATSIILVRHGETEVNAAGKMHSQHDQEKLNAIGRKQIIQTAEKLKNLGVNGVYASNEDRAKESANIISEVCRVPLSVMQGVEERNWGVYSKKTWPELNEILSKMNYKQRYEFTPPHGESLIDFEKRLNKVIQKIIIENPNRKVVLVSHGGAIRVMIGFLLDLPPEKRFVYEPPNASITILSYSNDIWETKLLLDTSHLG